MIALPVPAEYQQADARLRLLDVRRGRVAYLPLVPLPDRPLEQAEAEVLRPNLLQNADFTRGTEHWTLDNTALASARMSTPAEVSLPPGVKGKAIRVQVDAIGTHNWNIQLFQAGLNLREGQPYTLSFWGRADRERLLAVNVALDVPDWHTVGVEQKVSLRPEWRRYTFTFTATRTLENHNRLVFLLGDALGEVLLAAITLREGLPGSAVGPNLLRNADLAQGTESWEFLRDPAPASASVQILEKDKGPPALPSRSLRFDVKTPGSESWHIQWYQKGLDLQEAAHYGLTFWAKADRERPISVNAALDMPDWRNVGLDHRLLLTPQWRPYVLAFTAVRPESNHNRLSFILGETSGGIELAGLTLQRYAESSLAQEPSTAPVYRLTESDFQYVQTVHVSVKYQGKAVHGLMVTLLQGDKILGEHRLLPADNGVARFTDAPLNAQLTVSITDGNRTAQSIRTVSPAAPHTLGEIVLPNDWSGVQTLAGASPHPLIGVWESRGGEPSKRYRFTFNADGTGSIQPVTSSASPDAPPRSKVANPFRWYLTADGRRVVIGSQTYAWSISGSDRNEKLTLIRRNGRPLALYRKQGTP